MAYGRTHNAQGLSQPMWLATLGCLSFGSLEPRSRHVLTGRALGVMARCADGSEDIYALGHDCGLRRVYGSG